MNKSRFVLSLGLLLILPCFFFGIFVYSGTKMNVNQTDEAINNEKATSTEITVTNEGVSNGGSINSIGPIEYLIDQLIEKIQASSDECWRKPANNRKNTMINKLNGLKDLVSDDNLEDVYNKLLHEIKPKLTGLKTDENEEAWGNGVFKNPWVICPTLQEELRLICNDILAPPQPH
ncbi:MAG: hypothetical protein KAT57_03475 [Candidatus Lokiarchaeota archaeon]|nr:hypothetical protein [Candidatus Lokiarchaeota archaeon]